MPRTLDLEPEAAATEIGLAARLKDIYSKPCLRNGEDQMLFGRIRAGGPGAEAARVRLIEGVQKWVVKSAKEHAGRGVEFEDLIQAGNIGVLRAIEKFDPSKGFKFLTYAKWWINQAMGKACEDTGSIEKHGSRLPCRMYMIVGRVQKELSQHPEDYAGLDEFSLVEALAEKVRANNSSEVEVALDVIGRSQMSMDASRAGDDSEATVAEVIADEQAVRPLDELVAADKRAMILQAFRSLNEQEQRVLTMRLGLAGERLTQQQTCDALGITKSRMVAIQTQAESKLRASEEFREVIADIASSVD